MDEMKKISFIDIAIYIVFPLVVGFVLYYLFCPDVYFVGLIDKITNLNAHLKINYDVSLLRIIRYYAFDMLWAFSYTSTIVFVFKPKRRNLFDICIFISIAEILFETIQIFDFIKGTFDILDIAAEIFINVLVIQILIWRKY